MNIRKVLQENNIFFECDVPLKKKTWLKTGGTVSYWIEPDTIDKTIIIAKLLDEAGLKYEIIGHTSNIYYVDDTIPILSYQPLN